MNLRYLSPEIERFYSSHRVAWKDFYPSERFIFERVAAERGQLGDVLDVGGAVGGLGRALAEHCPLASYTCLDINPQAIAAATASRHTFPVAAEFICDDIVNEPPQLRGRQFEVVFCLSCADWNLEPKRILDACWRHVRPGGQLVLSLRLVSGATICDMARSYQFIRFDDGPLSGAEERANYVVFNAREALALLAQLSPAPAHLVGYGYWGKPSRTAVVPYERIGFTVFSVRKGTDAGMATSELHLPLDLLIGAE